MTEQALSQRLCAFPAELFQRVLEDVLPTLHARWSAIRNTNYYEMGLLHPKTPPSHPMPLYKDGYRDGLEAIDAKGHVPVPRGPGLGVELDWDWASRNCTA